ncbi:MAG: hypothetical protein Q4E17_04650 [Synergistes sp.]|nr:hypothetical protein [Synergistes sp.]
MLDSTYKIYPQYDLDDKKRASELAKMTLEQIRREYMRAIFTAACRRRLNIWDFAQKFMSSEYSLLLDKPQTMLAVPMDEIFGNFMLRCSEHGIEIQEIEGETNGMHNFRDISPEGAWLVDIYNRWHTKTGEACCEIAERAPVALLRKIAAKAMQYKADDIIELLIEHSFAAADISSKDYAKLTRED